MAKIYIFCLWSSYLWSFYRWKTSCHAARQQKFSPELEIAAHITDTLDVLLPDEVTRVISRRKWTSARSCVCDEWLLSVFSVISWTNQTLERHLNRCINYCDKCVFKNSATKRDPFCDGQRRIIIIQSDVTNRHGRKGVAKTDSPKPWSIRNKNCIFLSGCLRFISCIVSSSVKAATKI